MNTDRFTDHCAVTRGLQIIEDRAPLFSAHLAAIKENMERVAQEVIRDGHKATGEAMRRFANEL